MKTQRRRLRPSAPPSPDHVRYAAAAGLAGLAALAVYSWKSAPLMPAVPRQTLPIPDLQQADETIVRAVLRLMQAQLNALGYAAGPTDGVIGASTDAALSRFVAEHPVPVIQGESEYARLRRVATAIDAVWGARPPAR